MKHFHVFLAYAHSSMLKATAQHQGIQLVGELASCAGCSMANEICAPTPHHTTAWAATPMDMVHIYTVESYEASLGGSRYVVLLVDNASRLHFRCRQGGRASGQARHRRRVHKLGIH